LWPIFKSKKEGSALAEGVLSVPIKAKIETVSPSPVYYEQAQS